MCNTLSINQIYYAKAQENCGKKLGSNGCQVVDKPVTNLVTVHESVVMKIVIEW